MTPAEQRRQLLRWAAAAGLVPAAGLLLAEPGRQASGSAARPAPVLPGGASAAELPQHKPVPGGVALVPLGAAVQPPNAKLNGHAALIWGDTTQWTAVVGLPLSTPSAGVDLLVSDGLGAEAQRTIRIAVKPAHYAEQR